MRGVVFFFKPTNVTHVEQRYTYRITQPYPLVPAPIRQICKYAAMAHVSIRTSIHAGTHVDTGRRYAVPLVATSGSLSLNQRSLLWSRKKGEGVGKKRGRRGGGGRRAAMKRGDGREGGRGGKEEDEGVEGEQRREER